MLLLDALHSWKMVFSKPLRRILWQSLGLTLLLLLMIWMVLTQGASWWLHTKPTLFANPYAEGVAHFLAGAGLFVGLAYLLPAVSAVVAGFFLDDIAALVERDISPDQPEGTALSTWTSLGYGLRFSALSLLVNAAALMLFFIPGVNIAAFLLANSYLLGREYFELAASRFRPMHEAAAMRARHRMTSLSAGTLIALLIAVPFLNLLTPIFGIALMVRVHHRLSHQDPSLKELSSQETLSDNSSDPYHH